MQKFAPNDATPPPPPQEHWPSDELLAAYIDGNLGQAERWRIERHLGSCEDCYAIYAETVRFQLDSEPLGMEEPAAGEGKGIVVPFPSKKDMPNRWWYRIAALLVLGVGIGGVCYALFAPPPALVTAELTAPVKAKTGLAEKFWLGRTERGGNGENEGVPVREAAFRVGVQIVNLQVSLQAGDGDNATNVVSYILQALENQSTFGLDQSYKERITDAAVQGTPPRELVGAASSLSEESREILGPVDVDLGQWVEAGRLAAIAQEPSYFRRGDTRAFLRRLLWRQKLGLGEMKLDPAALESLRDISEVLEKKDLESSDYAKLRRSFEAILDVYYPQS